MTDSVCKPSLIAMINGYPFIRPRYFFFTKLEIRLLGPVLDISRYLEQGKIVNIKRPRHVLQIFSIKPTTTHQSDSILI